MWYPVVRQMRVCQSKEFTCEFTLCKPYTKFDPCDSIQYLLLCRNSRLQLAFRWSFWNGNRGQKLPSEHGRLGPLVFARFLIFLSAWASTKLSSRLRTTEVESTANIRQSLDMLWTSLSSWGVARNRSAHYLREWYDNFDVIVCLFVFGVLSCSKHGIQSFLNPLSSGKNGQKGFKHLQRIANPIRFKWLINDTKNGVKYVLLSISEGSRKDICRGFCDIL